MKAEKNASERSIMTEDGAIYTDLDGSVIAKAIKGFVLIDAGNGINPENLFDTGGRGEMLGHKGYRFYVDLPEAMEQADVANSQDCNVSVYNATLLIEEKGR